LPAEQFNLKNRGRLAVGCFADVLVFDPAEIAERTTYAEPHQLSSGMRHVLVNGVRAITESRQTTNRSGAFLG
jgi:N-acyl-D-amino-acid deacylase